MLQIGYRGEMGISFSIHACPLWGMSCEQHRPTTVMQKWVLNCAKQSSPSDFYAMLRGQYRSVTYSSDSIHHRVTHKIRVLLCFRTIYLERSDFYLFTLVI